MRILKGEEEAALGALVCLELEDALTVEQDVALGDPVGGVAHEGIREGGLPGAVRPHHGVHLVRVHCQVDALDDLGAVLEGDVQILQL